MTQEQLISTLIPTLIAPVSVAAVGYWVKNQLQKVEQISTILIEIRHIREKQTEIKLELERINKVRDDLILLKSEVKAVWKRVDEVKETMKHRGFS